MAYGYFYIQCSACFLGQSPQFAGQILFCPDVSAGHFQKLFHALNSIFKNELLILITYVVGIYSPGNAFVV